MTDYISRKEAIEAICAMECGDDSEDCVKRTCEVFTTLMRLPAAIRWIPCKERLPEEGRMVIVTIRGHDVIRCEDDETLEEAIDRVMKMLRVSVGFRDEDGWNGVEGYPMMVPPVAWMPLPEPFGADMREDDHED